ncbi:uncharacterized protein TRUGW13939_07639 [Talaromyces rugulosus]|uniref:Glycosyltransferase 2-like domain-containing protein n=1 Tax=Talaromyces rugulosus TaxID=121627 RepID=A0A7H8R284_TALRU|nr:uncharacterized protein TRUGW13939_07639 [Talaromyces rugulosus]QKX60494.1 hypothetical protein TRUGW13939_07639 [Talaromyces rugulosus]
MSENQFVWHCYFLELFAFRYVRLLYHIYSFWFLYRPAKIPQHPTYSPADISVVIPTVNPRNDDFEECLSTCLINKPKSMFIIGGGLQIEDIEEIVHPLRSNYHETEITVLSTKVANKRFQIARAIPFIQTKITVLLDDHVFWPSPNFLQTVLAPFEDPKVGIVGTNKRVRRRKNCTIFESIWNMLGALYLERHNFEIRATNAIDGGVFVISGRTSAHRTEILKNDDFIKGFTNERFFFRRFGPLNTDDDNYITRS